MKIYIACALTHVPRNDFNSYVEFIHKMAARLGSQGHAVKYALKDSDPQLAEKPFEERARLCYLWDRQMVQDADLVVAEASYPSIGLGIEMQIAEGAGIPIILCFREDDRQRVDAVRYTNPDHSQHDLQIGEGYVSLMALGVPEIARLVKYAGVDSGLDAIGAAVELVAHP